MTALIEMLSKAKIEYVENCAMSSRTSFKIGGAADILIIPANIEQLKIALSLCRETNTAYMILGKGSNLLVSDDGIEGAVISTERLNNITVDGKKIICDAGVSLTSLCLAAKGAALSGLEFAYGIPGSVGGAVYMNAGAYGGEMKDVVTSVTFLDEHGNVKTLSANELEFSYRKSVFSGKKCVIVSVSLQLGSGNEEQIGASMAEILGRRKDKQPLTYPSAGSVFKRPVGFYAGALIEESNLKGYKIGGAQVSEKHAGFIVNVGGATCDDVLALVEHIKSTVYKKHGVMLEPEIIKIGR